MLQRMSVWACLMYHEIPQDERAAGHFSVPRARFAAQLDRLHAAGKRVVTLEAMLSDPSGPTDGTAVTFDDGHSSHYTDAFPELVQRGMAATFFLITDRVGTPGYVTWAQAAEMAAAGMSLQSHTASHPFLSELSVAEATRELRSSKEALDDHLRQRTTTLALPGGDRAQQMREVLRSTGYRWLATSRWGPNGAENGIEIRRYTVRSATGWSQFDACAHAASPSWSPEGLRLSTLGGIRHMMGVSRYARWRRRILHVITRQRT